MGAARDACSSGKVWGASMTCLGCQRCETGPMVTLISGQQVCNYCPDWRLECEARYVASMETLRERREYLQHVQQKRGSEAYLELAGLVKQIWERRSDA